MAVDAQARFTCEMAEDEDGDQVVHIDFTDVRDQDAQSTSTMYYMDQMFQVFIDESSPERDIVIKMFHGPSNEERFLCVDLDEEAVDFLPPEEYPPTRFMLNIPVS